MAPGRRGRRRSRGPTLVGVDDPRDLLKEAGYVAVGLGLITVQRAQVRRRELAERFGDAGEQLERLSGVVEDRRRMLEERVESLGLQVDRGYEHVRARLPETALDVLGVAVGTARGAGAQLLDLLRPNTTAG